MGKRRQKPLMAEQGILHLKSSFVHPSDENGLLSTVGGNKEHPLVLSSGNYGYGIPVSVAIKNAEAAQAQANEEEVDPDIQMVREINGGVYSALELNKDRSGAAKGFNVADMSVAELVRSIGGARDAPLRRCDVVEDRTEVLNQTEGIEDNKEDPEANEFYASLGIANPKAPELNKEDGKDCDEVKDPDGERPAVEMTIEPGDNMTLSIADFYKSYTKYYYSHEPNPYGDQKLEFGLPIQKDNSPDVNIGGEQTIIQLARTAQIRARQPTDAAAALAKAKKAKSLGGDRGKIEENEADIFDPLPMEVVPSETAEELGITRDTTLDQYWEFIKEDPHDFNRWIYLIHYVESTNNITNCRKVYSAFLPLFSYCFGYWKRYSDLEKRFNYYGRALTILERALEFIPLSVDLWLSYLQLFCEIHVHHPDYEQILREQYERSLNSCGMEFRSDALWEAFIQWEIDSKRLKKGFSLYGRVMQVPTRLYNRHWDNFQALVRDHHPRDFLEKDEYEYLRKKGCKKLGLKYKEEPEYEMGEIRKPSKPEDKLMDYVKSKILKKTTSVHEKCEVECDKRWIYEDRIRRPYFHTKALDQKQLRNWEEYLNFEILEGNHDRIVLLFERCLISCAMYEKFWCKYARYLEDYHKKNPSSNQEISIHFQKIQESMEIGSQKEIEEEENRIKDVQFTLNNIIKQIEGIEQVERHVVPSCLKFLISQIEKDEQSDEREVTKVLSSVVSVVAGVEINDADILCNGNNNEIEVMDVVESVIQVHNATEDLDESDKTTEKIASPKLNGDSDSSDLPFNCGEQETNAKDGSHPEFASLLSIPVFPHSKYSWQEAVRDVYKRACIVHCPKKYIIRLQWAAFEEELGNNEQSRQLILHVQLWFPSLIEAKMQLIELERRSRNHQTVVGLFEKYMPQLKITSEYSIFAMKYARFLHKEMKKPDKALQILRKAIKKQKANPRLYLLVIEICYERYPSDQKGAFAALELALSCKEFSDEQKIMFLKRKLFYLQEHADIMRYRDAVEQLNNLKEVLRKKEIEEFRKKEEELRLNAGIVNPDLTAFPVPDRSALQHSNQNPVPIDFEVDQIISSPAEKEVDSVVEESSVFQKIPPPADLDLNDYGYSSKHPDYKMAEYMAQKEYDKLEGQGRADHLKDTDEQKSSRKRKVSEEKPVYIIQPKSSTMYRSSVRQSNSTVSTDPNQSQTIELEAPQQLSEVAVPSNSPCVNVPEWFIKEGGELCLSETRVGFSVIRYWPHFLNDIGQQKMFKAVRRSVKWHQKQRVVYGKWKHVPRLLSWLGPCDWTDKGLEMKKNEDWPPEILDLLHRINQITQHEFNSCFLNLYRTGHDCHPWHGDIHPAYGANPAIATISLGSLRLFEMRRRGTQQNFIRFPLFPGSLLIMEGACQEDWSHQIPRDPKVQGERISLVFRVMHAIENIEKNGPEKSLRNTNESNQDQPINELGRITPLNQFIKKKETLLEIEKSNLSKPSVFKKNNAPPGSSKANDTEVEVIEQPSQTRILFHKKL